ncbi:hypothetical protein F5Y15DRAFT_61891 [Xylariaceae sp. FL0016]|nr:hypothetical protein F5Y15DRAFT_61891 [Xylariaceae sp. FL0016]
MTFIFPVERADQQSTLACSVIFSVLPVTTVSLRIHCRNCMNRRLDSSDWCIIAACITTVIYQGVVMSCVLTGGLGFHVDEIVGRFGMSSGSEIFIKHLLAIQNFWAVSLSLSKISILMLCSKVFVINSYVIIARSTAVFICLWALATILSCFLICQPFAYNWDLAIPGGYCGNSIISWTATGILNIITDMIVLMLPMPYLWGLELELFKKLVLMATFGVGLFTCIISIIRVKLLSGVDFADVTYTISNAVLFSALEPCLAITLACVPVLRPLLPQRYQPSESAKIGASTIRRMPRSGRFDSKPGQYSSTEQLRPDPFRQENDVETGTKTKKNTMGDGGDVELQSKAVRKTWGIEFGR